MLAFPNLPPLPALPSFVDPDGWLHFVQGKRYIRRVNPAGIIKVDKHSYYVGRVYQKQYVVLTMDAKQKQFVVRQKEAILKQLPLKGLHGGTLSFADYLTLISQEAISEWRHYQRQQVRYSI